MSKHTPGPWNNLPRHECVPICRQDEAGLSIGFVHSSDPERQAQGLANAFLIAAAPDLLEALEDLFKIGSVFTSAIESIDPYSGDFEKWEVKARAAIAKAKGEQE